MYHLQLQWFGLQVRSAHPSFVLAFDHLSPDEVIWEPYENQRIDERVGSYGLSPLYFRDATLWLTRKKLVVDITVEDYAPHRVMR